jgi:hypothetical protein
MENKEIYSKEIEETKITKVLLDKGVSFELENGKKISLVDYHESDCCENVYADFSIYKYLITDLVGKEINHIVIKSVENMGFLVCVGLKETYNNFISFYSKVFVPCYNSQNGYYSSNLELQISYDNVETKIDISNLVEDHVS